MKELHPIEETWNKKRIILGLGLLLLVVSGLTAFKILVLDKNQNPPQSLVKKTTTAVKGESANISENPISGLKTNIADQINTIKQEASNINLTEIATSSPQVQKVLEDIKAIQNLPKNQAKSFCEQVCSGL